MPLRLKQGLDPEALRAYGFKRGAEFFGKERWCGDGSGYEYQGPWMHKFLMHPDHPETVFYTDDDDDIPMVQMSFRLGVNYHGDLDIDCAPSCTYHIGGSDLDIVTDTIFALVRDGFLELFDTD